MKSIEDYLLKSIDGFRKSAALLKRNIRTKLPWSQHRSRMLIDDTLPRSTNPVPILFIFLLAHFVTADETNRDFKPVTLMKPLPAISDAPVITRQEIKGKIDDKELVLGVAINGSARAYPINMLNGPRREIINDTLGGQAIAATW